MRFTFLILFSFLYYMPLLHAQSTEHHSVRFDAKPNQNKVEVYFDDDLFTAYIYPEQIMKPVLWPVRTSDGTAITRNFPLEKAPGERTDHPHHVGIWFNYGDVNGIDYWNNSEAIPSEKKNRYGEIRHQEIISMNASGNRGELVVKSEWIDTSGGVLDETTRFTFYNEGKTRIIDREAILTARKDILFEDNKEGMLGIRVAPELEIPSDDKIKMTNEKGLPSNTRKINDRASGDYLSSEGIRGHDVWGTRAAWMDLSGHFGNEKVHVVIIDHPQNPGYPTYWHARGYGLYAANPLGQKAMSGGKEELHFQLKEGETSTFRYRMIISNDETAGKDLWDQMADKFKQ